MESLTLKINDFSKGLLKDKAQNIASLNSAVSTYNFNFNNGALVEGMGVSLFKVPTQTLDDSKTTEIHYKDFTSQIKSIAWYSGYSAMHGTWRDRILFSASDNNLYYFGLNTSYSTLIDLECSFTQKFTGYNLKINGEDRIVLVNPTDKIVMWNGQVAPIVCEDCPVVKSLCEYKNRLYFITGDDFKTIRYTTNYNIKQWEKEALSDVYGEGKLEINDGKGKLNKLLSFENYMYVFRDYNIVKIMQYADKNSTLSWSNIYNSSAMIYSQTAKICGDKIIMLTRDGLVSFDGVNAKKLTTGFDSLIKGVDNRNAVAEYHGGKYYLACKANFLDDNIVESEALSGAQNNALICYDPLDSSYMITRGIDICDLVSITADCLNKLVCCFNVGNISRLGEVDTNGKFFDINSPKYWCSPLSDLGYSGNKKIVKQLSLFSAYDCTITVFTESEQKQFNVKGSQKLNKFPVRLCGKQVGIKVQTNSQQAYISNITLKVDLIESENAI